MGGTGRLPSKETFLVNASEKVHPTITIPHNVKVIKVYISGYYSIYGESSTNGYSILYNSANNCQWLKMSGGDSTVSSIRYIGVTSSKLYNLFLTTRSATINKFTISYSAAINECTPTVTDY